MALTISYTKAREQLADVLDQVENDQEDVIITRKGHEDVALVSAAELAALRETAHLMRSPRNALRLLQAFERASAGKRRKVIDIEMLSEELALRTPRKTRG
jgi:antitoxin YefM